ncbi:MAG: methionyl-tRNA formyltransferase [Phormidesmis sp.]
MKIVFFGTPQFAVPSLERLLAHPSFDVVAVVTQPDKRRGRGSKVTPSPVKAAAQASRKASNSDCPIWQPERIKKDRDALTQLEALKADAFVVIAYGQILSQQILDMPRLGCINAHGSILPAYRGAAPIQWCLYKGERETGVTTMLMDAGMDTGPMLMKETVAIDLLDNAWQVAEKLSALSAAMLPATLEKLHQQTIRPITQVDEQATYAPLIKKEDYRLDWGKSAKALHDQVRGFYPSCTAQFRGEALKVMATVPLGTDYWQDLPPAFTNIKALYEAANIAEGTLPGTIASTFKRYGPVVQTGSGYLLLCEMKPAGKKVLSGWDFVNGNRVEIGEQLG